MKRSFKFKFQLVLILGIFLAIHFSFVNAIDVKIPQEEGLRIFLSR